MAGPNFVYIDYGPSPDLAIELKYSVATLFEEYQGAEPEVIVYTDKPAAYLHLHPRVNVREIGAELAAWSRDGLYNHRIKPCALADALRTLDGPCALVDTDTFFREGFRPALAQALEKEGPAMDHFERADPCPACANLPEIKLAVGGYVYDPAAARMFNSGLVACRPSHLSAIEDSLRLIDGWLDAGVRQLNLEQIAVSESFRRHGFAISEMKPTFEHYYLRSQKLYMRPRLAAWLQPPHFEPTRPRFEPTKTRVKIDRLVKRLTKLVYR